MSTSTQETTQTSRRAHRHENGQEPVAAPVAAPVVQTEELEIAGQKVSMPVRYGAGHVLNDNEAKVLSFACFRQFTNNQNAMFKASVTDKADKATTDAERAAVELARLNFTPEALLKKFIDYLPSIGGTRTGSMEKIRQDAAWRMWTALVQEHNTSVGNGGAPVIVKAGTQTVPGLKPKRDASGKVIATVAEQRERMIERILEMPEYTDRVQSYVDIIMAEKGASKAETPAANSVDLGSLFN